MITEGQVEMKTKEGTTFMILPEDSLFNEYTLIFDLKSNIIFKSFMPTFESLEYERNAENMTRTMNLDAETFKDLLEMYPDTAKNLTLRALEKRSIFMYYKQKVTTKHLNGKLGSRPA